MLFTSPSLSPQTARPDVQEDIFMLEPMCGARAAPVAPGWLPGLGLLLSHNWDGSVEVG